MDHVNAQVADKVQQLSDLELATLLCLVAEQHCIIQAEEDSLDDLEQELALVASDVFGLSSAVLHCSERTGLDDFSAAILTHAGEDRHESSTAKHATDEHSDALPKTKLPSFEPVHASDPADALGNRKIPNIVILRDLDWANHHVQIQTLELIRAKRIFTRTEVQAAPKRFLVIALLSKQSEKRLNPHLNDQFFISHYHAPQDGLPNSEEHEDLNDAASASSVLRTSFSDVLPELRTNPHPLFPQEFVTTLQLLTSRTLVSAPVLAYLHNITIHLRLHRFVSAPSITATATRHFRLLTRALAPLHALSYVPPSLVALAARKVYMHRVLLVRPEEERSMQWGSEIEAVREAMVGVSVEGVVEEVLGAVEVPL